MTKPNKTLLAFATFCGIVSSILIITGEIEHAGPFIIGFFVFLASGISGHFSLKRLKRGLLLPTLNINGCL